MGPIHRINLELLLNHPEFWFFSLVELPWSPDQALKLWVSHCNLGPKRFSWPLSTCLCVEEHDSQFIATAKVTGTRLRFWSLSF